jgi:hypothetical protein
MARLAGPRCSTMSASLNHPPRRVMSPAVGLSTQRVGGRIKYVYNAPVKYREMKAMKKTKRGRPPMAEGREKFTTTLPDYVVKHLRKIGNGNASAGICWLVDEHLKEHPAVRLRG